MNLLDYINAAEKLLDDANGEWGYEHALCLFCKSTEHNSKVGIYHTEHCPIMQLRIMGALELSSSKGYGEKE